MEMWQSFAPLLAVESNILDYANPFRYVDPDKYVSFWAMLFATAFEGVFARVFAVAFLGLAFWMGVYRQRFASGLTFYTLSIMFTYFGALLKTFFEF